MLFPALAAFAAPPTPVPALHLQCASLAHVEDLGPMGSFVRQVTDHVPTDGPAEVWQYPASQGSELRIALTLTDPSVLPAWLATYGYVAAGPGKWTSSAGAAATLTDGQLVITRHDGVGVTAPTVPIPKLLRPKTGCAMAFESAPRPPLVNTPVGVLAEFPAENQALLRLALPEGAKHWAGKRPAGLPLARGQFVPEAAMRLNLADPATILRGVPTKGMPGPGPFDVRWLDAIADHLAPGTELVFVQRDYLAVFPLTGVTPAAILAKLGVVPEDGVLAVTDDKKDKVYLTSVATALVVASSRKLAADIHNGVGDPFFADDPAWRAPGFQIVSTHKSDGMLHMAFVADHGLLRATVDAESLSRLETQYDGKSGSRAYLPRSKGVLPTWPPEVPRADDVMHCETRFEVDPGGRVENLAVWGCPDAFVAAVRKAAPSWQYPVGKPSIEAVSLRERSEKIAIEPPPRPLRDAPPRAVIAGFTTTPSGLRWADVTVGTGVIPAAGQEVAIEWSGWRADGVPVGSTYEGKNPLTFRLGSGWGLPAWEEAIATMHLGGRRQIVSPPALAYGAGGLPPRIPPDATLTYEIELVAVDPPPPAPDDLEKLFGGQNLLLQPGLRGLVGSPSPPPPDDLGISQAVVTGALAPELIREVVNRHGSQLRYCYQREQVRSPKLAGVVSVDAVIVEDGTVPTATAKPSVPALDVVASCIEGRFLRMQFPQPKSGIVKLHYGLTFAPP
jgi:hypothetical protein